MADWIMYGNKSIYFGSKKLIKTLPPFTLRFQFTDNSYDPRNDSSKNSDWKSRWKLVDATSGIYDWTYVNSSWESYFSSWECPSTYSIIDAGDTSGVTNFWYMFYNSYTTTSHNLLSTVGFDLSSATGNYYGVDDIFSNCQELRSIPYFNLTGVKHCSGMFTDCTSLTSVSPDLDFSSATHISYLFYNTALETIPNFDFGNATRATSTFRFCRNLKSLPNLNLSKIKTALGFISDCSSLTAIPQCMYSLTSVTDVTYILDGCVNIASGILDFYNFLSTKQVTVTDHDYAFRNCGSNTVTGAAELAMIPQSWGGLANG